MSACHMSAMLERNDIGAYRLGKILKNYTDKSLRLIVVKALDFQHRGPGFKTTGWLQSQLSLSFFLGRSVEYKELLGTEW